MFNEHWYTRYTIHHYWMTNEIDFRLNETLIAMQQSIKTVKIRASRYSITIVCLCWYRFSIRTFPWKGKWTRTYAVGWTVDTQHTCMSSQSNSGSPEQKNENKHLQQSHQHSFVPLALCPSSVQRSSFRNAYGMLNARALYVHQRLAHIMMKYSRVV